MARIAPARPATPPNGQQQQFRWVGLIFKIMASTRNLSENLRHKFYSLA
jgi:hypothetical protein